MSLSSFNYLVVNSAPETFRQMVEIAEEAIKSLKERDRLYACLMELEQNDHNNAQDDELPQSSSHSHKTLT
jgi:hypothetical protein